MLSQSQLDRDIQMLKDLKELQRILNTFGAHSHIDRMINDLNASISRQKDGE